MKSKKRHYSSEDDSEDSDGSDRSSSSDSESDSSASEHRHRKKKKCAESSDTDSSEDRKHKKRKHKKKKKKHVKRRRRSESVDSRSDGGSSGDSERSHKKKHKKQKHKRSRSSSASVIIVDDRKERRLHSVVKERKRSSENERPTRTYYQKEYRSESPVDEVERQRQREVQRFYRGSSKERRYQEQLHYQEQERNERLIQYQQDASYANIFQLDSATDMYQREQRISQNQRNARYESRDRPPPVDEYRRPREESYHSREQRGQSNRYNQYEERGPKRNVPDARDNRERDRRGPSDGERYRDREYQDRREKYSRDETLVDRGREVRRDRPPPRDERPPHTYARGEAPRGESEDRRERGRRAEPERRDDRYRESRDEPRREQRRPPRERDSNTQQSKDKKSRFADADADKEYSWGKTEIKKEGNKDGEKEKPNFGLSGKLTADTNMVNGVVIKYSEPDDAKQPKRRWRFYPFKGDKALPILYIHRQSAFLIGRDKKVCDITLEHPSISKQHAALQYRATPFTRPDGSQGRRVRPYVIDLESANGTFVNNKKIEPRRYVELLEKDVVKFGFSQREYVLLHENSKDDAQDDDNQEPSIGVTTTDQIKQEKRIKQEAAEDGE